MEDFEVVFWSENPNFGREKFSIFDLNLTIMHIAEEIFGIFILAPWRDCVIVNISVQFCNNGFKKGIILEYDPTGFVLTHIERELDVSVFFWLCKCTAGQKI